ncbi:MAG: hypothetical protein RML45_16260 [Acetobacteraceae bacterium]|nr:hypothetical protein [Acetobacteraceae bacterium]
MTFHELVTLLLSRWRACLLTALGLWTCSCFLIGLVPTSFRARAIIVPAETTGIAVSNLLSPIQIMSPSLLEAKPSGNFAVYLSALRSREIIRVLRQETALADILAEEAKTSLLGKLRKLLKLSENTIDDDKILEWLEHNTSATSHTNSIVWMIEVRHKDPLLALSVLRTLHAAAEARVRDEITAMLSRRISWLAERAATEPDATVRTALHELAAQAHRHLAILASDGSVAARLVSAPAVDDRPTVPNRPFLAVLAFIGSLKLSACIWATIGTTRRMHEVNSLNLKFPLFHGGSGAD